LGKRLQVYKKGIIRELYFGKMLSCADLSVKIGKSLPTTAKTLGQLLDDELVIETGFSNSTGGRRPQLYTLRRNIMSIVSVAMDQFITRIVMMDLHNGYLTEIDRIELELKDNSRGLEILAVAISEHIRRSGVDKSRIAGIGIGMPGFVDVAKGINHSFLSMHDGRIDSYIAAQTGLPVFIDNDSQLVALGELCAGNLDDQKNAAVINIGWGIGLGLILNGKLFRGHNGFAGEFSHIPLFTNNKLCSCGKMGCLETEASLMVAVEKMKTGLLEGRLSNLKLLKGLHVDKAVDALIRATQSGDKFAIEVLSETGYSIGRGLAVLVHLLNPEKILLSGRGAKAGRIWEAPIQQGLNEHCIPALSKDLEVEVSGLGHSAELLGAAALVMENYDKEI
jgi:predicted NBD/HSP70 family sugar kinase